MEISAEVVRGILEHRLTPAAVERLLAELPDAGKAQLLLRIAGLLETQHGAKAHVIRRKKSAGSAPSPEMITGIFTVLLPGMI